MSVYGTDHASGGGVCGATPASAAHAQPCVDAAAPL